MSDNDAKKPQQAAGIVQSDMDRLQEVLKHMNVPGQEALLEHMTGKNGLLKPVGEMLNKLLEDPIVRQAMIASPLIDQKKH